MYLFKGLSGCQGSAMVSWLGKEDKIAIAFYGLLVSYKWIPSEE